MPEYKGNAIYDYVTENNLEHYYFSAENSWLLIYGNTESIPKILVFASKVSDINSPNSEEEKNNANRACRIAYFLNLPFVLVRFALKGNMVSVWESQNKSWRTISYEQLRNLYESYGVVQPGTAAKGVNQYLSSSYHDWQRNSLGPITVSDFDLLKYRNDKVEEIIELKRSKVAIDKWKPYSNDFPNFALLINTIVGSGKKIPFRLYYNLMKDGQIGNREEDISQIKVFEFVIPDNMVSAEEIKFRSLGIHTIDELLLD